MRKAIWTLALAAVALCGALAFSTGKASAGSTSFTKRVTGVYLNTYTIAGLGSFQSFLTVNADGTGYASDWNDQGMPAVPALGGAKNGPNHMSWQQTGKKSLAAVLVCYVYSAAGDPVGVQVTTGDATTEDFVEFSYALTVKTYALTQDFEDPAVVPAMGSLTATGTGHQIGLD